MRQQVLIQKLAANYLEDQAKIMKINEINEGHYTKQKIYSVEKIAFNIH